VDSWKGLSVEGVAKAGDRLLQTICPFIPFEIIQNGAWLCVNKREDYGTYIGKRGVCGDNAVF
jgi:hypothetical protein